LGLVAFGDAVSLETSAGVAKCMMLSGEWLQKRSAEFGRRLMKLILVVQNVTDPSHNWSGLGDQEPQRRRFVHR
jgi:hypothetical protein